MISKPEEIFKGWYPDGAAQNHPNRAPRESAFSYDKSEKPPDFSLAKFSDALDFSGDSQKALTPWPARTTSGLDMCYLKCSALTIYSPLKEKRGGAVLAPGNSWGWDKRPGREWVRRAWGKAGAGLETHSLRRERSGDFALRTVEQCSLYWFLDGGLSLLWRVWHFPCPWSPKRFALLRKLSFFSYHLAGANASFISQLKCHLKWQWPCLTAARGHVLSNTLKPPSTFPWWHLPWQT